MAVEPTAAADIAGPATSPDASPDARALRRQQAVTLLLLTLGYAGFYLCRANLSVVTPLIVRELGGAGIAKADALVKIGHFVSLAALAYGVGKFVGGMLGDVGGGRRNFLIGMGGSVGFTVLFTLGSAGAVPIFTLAWMGNRLVQSLGWPGMMKIAGRSFRYQSFGVVAAVLSLSFLFGDAASKLFMGVLLAHGVAWRGVFLINAGILASWFVVTLLFLREKPAALGTREFPPSPESLYSDADGTPPGVGPLGLLGPLLSSPSFLIACGLSLAMTLLRETFNTWTPEYFVDVLKLTPAAASTSSMWFPLLGGMSVLLAGWLNDRLGRGGRAVVITLGLSLSGAVMYGVGGADAARPMWGVAVISLVGFLLIGPYSYLAGSVSLDFGGSRGAATTCGIIDGVGYFGSYLAGEPFAKGLKYYGWGRAFHLLAIITWVAAGLGFVFWITQRKPKPIGTEGAT